MALPSLTTASEWSKRSFFAESPSILSITSMLKHKINPGSLIFNDHQPCGSILTSSIVNFRSARGQLLLEPLKNNKYGPLTPSCVRNGWQARAWVQRSSHLQNLGKAHVELGLHPSNPIHSKSSRSLVSNKRVDGWFSTCWLSTVHCSLLPMNLQHCRSLVMAGAWMMHIETQLMGVCESSFETNMYPISIVQLPQKQARMSL